MFGAHNVSFLQIITPAAALAAVQFLLNTGGVAIIVALDSRKSVYQVWRRNLSWTAVAYLSGASVAALIAVSANSFSLGVIAAAAPILLITHVMYNTYREKVQNHITELQELNNLYMRTVESLALAVDAKDRSTHGHIRRVRAFALGLAKLRGVTDADEILGIETAALLHDIGKLAIEDFILNKPGRLSSQEFERMKIHTLAGEEIIQQIQFPFPVAEYVRSHHEHWDGTGYPLGLKGDQIPLGARILAVADSYDAIRSSRPYKASRGVHEAATIVRRDAGTAFDPVLAELFVQNIEQLEKGASAAARLTKELTFRDRTRSDAISPPAALPEINPAALSCDLFALHQFCSCAAHTLELEELLPIVARRIAGLIPYASCAFFLLTSDNTLEVPYAAGECKELFEKAKIAVGLGISGWVAAYRRPMLNVAARLEFNDPDPTLFELQDALVVPLAIGEEAIGTVSLYGAKAGSYSEHDCATLQAVARIAAPAIADARLRAHSPSDRRRDIVTENHCVANISLG
jgi:putative methionine-R-sulfoxide reductase with GAF domain